MLPLILIAVVLVASVLTSLSAASGGSDRPVRDDLSLEEALRAIKRELAQISAAPGADTGLPLRAVTVELVAERKETRSGNAAITVPVFTTAALAAKTSAERSETSKVKITFDPPAGSPPLFTQARRTMDLSELVAAVRSALLASRAEGQDLAPRTVDIELMFVLVEASGAEASVKAKLIELGAGRDRTRKAANTVALRYGAPPAPPAPSAPTSAVPHVRA